MGRTASTALTVPAIEDAAVHHDRVRTWTYGWIRTWDRATRPVPGTAILTVRVRLGTFLDGTTVEV
ncbi:hypothetical protein [Streptomyces sp. NPDC005262]|uniref:hypothetical protein n=1 Tax=Streptomyces sp. NPDC005262 TaxID=3364710 RepID=UPI0036918AA1